MNKLKKGLASVSLALVILCSTQVSFANNLNDINSEKLHWGYETMQKLVHNKILQGYEDGSLKPDKNITRAEFITIINNTFKFTEKGINTFDDVKNNEWYFQEVEKALDKNYVNLISDDIFEPNKEITREEVGAIMGFILNESESKDVLNFKDKDNINGKYKEYINGIAKKEYINGYEDNTFKPKENITRAEAATIINKSISKIYSTSGTYNETISGNLLITSKDVNLKDSLIKGNLYVSGDLEDGDVLISNSKIEGNINLLSKNKKAIKLDEAKEVKEIKSLKDISSKSSNRSRNKQNKIYNNDEKNVVESQDKEEDKIKENNVVNKEKTKITEVEGVLFLVVTLNKGSMEDYKFSINNENVQMSKVNKSGNILKVELKERKDLNLKISKNGNVEEVKVDF